MAEVIDLNNNTTSEMGGINVEPSSSSPSAAAQAIAEAWSVDQVCNWLEAQPNVAQHTPLFREHNVDGKMLKSLTFATLKREFLITMAKDCRHIIQAVATVFPREHQPRSPRLPRQPRLSRQELPVQQEPLQQEQQQQPQRQRQPRQPRGKRVVAAASTSAAPVPAPVAAPVAAATPAPAARISRPNYFVSVRIDNAQICNALADVQINAMRNVMNKKSSNNNNKKNSADAAAVDETAAAASDAAAAAVDTDPEVDVTKSALMDYVIAPNTFHLTLFVMSLPSNGNNKRVRNNNKSSNVATTSNQEVIVVESGAKDAELIPASIETTTTIITTAATPSEVVEQQQEEAAVEQQSEHLEKAKQILRSCTELIETFYPAAYPPKLQIKGVGSFSGRVVYASVAEGPHRTKLLALSSLLQSEFKKAGLLVDEINNELHVTLMKTSKGRPKFGSKKPLIRSFPVESYTPFAEYDFGEQIISSVELSSMQKKDEEGYYACMERVPITTTATAATSFVSASLSEAAKQLLAKPKERKIYSNEAATEATSSSSVRGARGGRRGRGSRGGRNANNTQENSTATEISEQQE